MAKCTILPIAITASFVFNRPIVLLQPSIFEHPNAPSIHFVPSNAMGDLAQLLRNLEAKGFVVFKLPNVQSKEELLARAAEVMQFPDYFGWNWDALHECMIDLATWLPPKRYIVILRSGEDFQRSNPEDLDVFLDIFAEVSKEWLSENVPFHLVLVGSGELKSWIVNNLEEQEFVIHSVVTD